MSLLVISRVMGGLLCFFSLTFLIPLVVSLIYSDGEWTHFLSSLVITMGAGLLLWLPARYERKALRARDSFVIVAFFWAGLGLVGALPFIFGSHLSVVDAVFEAVSGLTTTGATMIVGLDNLPPSILWYRQQLQWVGGAGVIVLAVAILPLLGVGGMQLFKAETPGPMKDEKLTPRITHTARYLWYIYLGLTLACGLSYWIAGMTLFDAITHSFATVSTGGFSTHDASLSHFNSPVIEIIAEVFMLLGGINFAVHFVAFTKFRVRQYFGDSEVRVFLIIVAIATGLVTSTLWLTGKYTDGLQALRYASFQVITVITSTGFATDNFSAWPLFLPVFMMFIGFIGGCAGSTAGGIKVVRVMLLAKQGAREIMGVIHQYGVIPVKLGGRVMNERILAAVYGFFSVYVGTFVILMLIMLATGLDQVTAFSAVATCMNNLGPGLGQVASNFVDINPVAKITAVFAMLLGRLEVFTMLVLLSPAFWRK